jgi:hypothetical protein
MLFKKHTRSMPLIFVAIAMVIACEKKELVRNYYENGALMAEYTVKDSKKNGWLKSYYQSGALNFEGEFVDDQRVGWHTMYYEKTGKIKKKLYYTLVGGNQKVEINQEFTNEGVKYAETRFVKKEFDVTKLSPTQLYQGDTLALKVKVKDPKYPYVKVRLGHFDESRNVEKYEPNEHYFDGNLNHEVFMNIFLHRSGHGKLTALILDYKIENEGSPNSVIVGEESYFEYQFEVEAKKDELSSKPAEIGS